MGQLLSITDRVAGGGKLLFFRGRRRAPLRFKARERHETRMAQVIGLRWYARRQRLETAEQALELVRRELIEHGPRRGA